MESSCTICVATTRKPSFFKISATAGPETSTRSPRAQESLTVTTAAVSTTGRGSPCDEASIVEEDIFFLFPPSTAAARARAAAAGRNARAGGTVFRADRLAAAIALRFVEQAQAFHEQALGVELGSFLIGLAFEVEFEVAARPAQNFEYGFVS